MSNVHNEDFDFATQAPREHQLAFSGSPRRVLLPASTRLYRFLSGPSGGFGGNELFKSPWWYPSSTFNALTRITNRTGASLTAAARSRLAVTQEWNPAMDKVAVVELRVPVYAWQGPTAHQPARQGDRSMLLLGNFDQVYVPNLASDAQGLSSKFGMLIHHGSVQ